MLDNLLTLLEYHLKKQAKGTYLRGELDIQSRENQILELLE